MNNPNKGKQMQSNSRFLDDVAKVANTAISSLAGLKDEIEVVVRHKIENYLCEIDLVKREEFNITKKMLKLAIFIGIVCLLF